MALVLRITRRASCDVERAERWWLSNRQAAPDAFREDLKGAFTLLLRQYDVGVKVASAKLAGVRRLYLGRVRYQVYYRVFGPELIILAVWHASRSEPRL